MLIPEVKKQVALSAACKIPKRITYTYKKGCAEAELGACALASFVRDAEQSDCGAFISFAPDATLEDRSEIYSVRVLEDGILIGFRDARGAVNAAATVALMLRKDQLYPCEIVDYPSCEYRSLMIDMARGLPTYEDIEAVVRYMALAKFNRLHLHLCDSKGPCFASDAVPEYKYMGEGGQCEKAMLARIDELCHSYAIEIVPEIEIPAHATALCSVHPEFKCGVENAHVWTLCPSSEGVWEFYEALVAEVAQTFPRSEYIHIGSDELEFLDQAKPRICHWDECPKCRALREREGLADKREEFYYLINRMHDIVRAHGKKMMMWNDQIDVSKEVPISRDIIVECWRVAKEGRGPNKGCSLDKLLDHGFKVINASFENAYFDDEAYMSSEKMKTWSPLVKQCGECAQSIIGAEACAWEFGNYGEYPFYGYVAPSVIAIFGDKLWGLRDMEYTDQYKAALSEFIFGTAELSEVFDYVGDVIPPRCADRYTYADASTLSPETIHKCIDKLKTLPTCFSTSKYVYLLEKIAETCGISS